VDELETMKRTFPPSFALYPAIDLRRGQVVRLTQGRDDATTVYGTDPVDVVTAYQEQGAQTLHLVDLDAAFGDGDNRAVIRRVLEATSLPVQVGGGVRDETSAQALFDAGVSRVIIGSRAAEDPAWVGQMVQAFGADRIVVGIDARDGQVMLRGWVEGAALSATEVASRVASVGVRTVIYTNIANDGMLTGPDLVGSAALAMDAGVDVIVSGGVGTLDHVIEAAAWKPAFAGLIIGKALFEGRFTLRQALEV
jgi:phosphoribosylformimino-5-aminoimidazole carboxamide ribotide isomerase